MATGNKYHVYSPSRLPTAVARSSFVRYLYRHSDRDLCADECQFRPRWNGAFTRTRLDLQYGKHEQPTIEQTRDLWQADQNLELRGGQWCTGQSLHPRRDFP